MANDALFVAERWDRIRGILDQKGRVTVEELADVFGVSRSTIRRDLLDMHEKGLLVRTRGGAVRSQMVSYDRSISESGTINVSLKEKIGATAARLVSAGETIMIDAGSTTREVVEHLRASGITLVTNSFDVITSAMSKPEIESIMVGGMVRKHGGATVGPNAEDQISSFKADTAIIGINGISADEGLTTPNMLVAQVKRAMIAQSRRLIVVADNSKLGVAALCRVASLDAVDVLVTDDGSDEEIISGIRAAGVEVVIAE